VRDGGRRARPDAENGCRVRGRSGWRGRKRLAPIEVAVGFEVGARLADAAERTAHHTP
jgi:hypothetical protein